MLETPLYPTLSRVIRVTPGPDDKPAQGFSWDDYEDVAQGGAQGTLESSVSGDGEDEGSWGVVKSRKRTSASYPPSLLHSPFGF